VLRATGQQVNRAVRVNPRLANQTVNRPFLQPALRQHRWKTINICDPRPAWCQTYGYLPCHKASPTTGNQIILLGDNEERNSAEVHTGSLW